MVIHPFVTEMGDGTLPPEKFRRYFLQDYVFVADLVAMVAHGTAKAPTFEAANVLNKFLAGIINPENDLFMRAFDEFGVTEEEYSHASALPTTQALGDFLVRTGLEGSFDDIATILYVTEGTYLDWGTRLIEAGKKPDNPIYREWIELHGPAVLGDLVEWLGDHLDGVDLAGREDRIERIFLTALRYEHLFWEMAYNGEEWP
jgi:thiaminase/transcriptional activator TenA